MWSLRHCLAEIANHLMSQNIAYNLLPLEMKSN